MASHIISKDISSVSFYREAPSIFRLDTVPFFIFYLGVAFSWLKSQLTEPEKIPSDANSLGIDWQTLLTILIVFLHILTFLFTFWSIDFKAFVQCKKVSKISDATLLKVSPAVNKGKKELCKLEKNDKGEVFFWFQKRKFLFSSEKKQFEKLQFPVHHSYHYYLTSKGHHSEELKGAEAMWGKNKFDIPQPSFSELYKEQALAPFFIFQVFCVLLWCLDEYWYYSLFTLFLLLTFEATVVKSRQKNLSSLRNMGLPARPISVYRGGKWTSIDSYSLLPGDICSLTVGKVPTEDTFSPCDMLLLDGTCVVNESMLTGESTPRIKESIANQNQDNVMSMKQSQLHIIYGGTKIIQNTQEKQLSIIAPDGGCTAYVLRTGFNTTQGKLMRMILFSTERMTANTKESLMFIAFLLIFALAASGYVLTKGLEDPDRSRYKLLLNCTLIITSVVPPELPMELSLAVNNSLLALFKLGIFCTEPFRIPFAGKLDVCCFDKTGTLTSDNIICKGVALPDGGKEAHTPMSLSAASEAPSEVLFTLSGCHSLIHVDTKLVGDPMETAALNAINWSFTKGETASPKKGNTKLVVRIVHRYHFNSTLKRMAAIVSLDHEREPTVLVVAKGAPEKIKQLLDVNHLPANYDATFKHFSRQGCRVLALAYKHLKAETSDKLRRIPREVVESELLFAGFVVFECPLKADSLQSIQMIKGSSHKVCMITGDNTLTACHVASQLQITSKPVLTLTVVESVKNSDQVNDPEWRTIDETQSFPFSIAPKQLIADYDLCVSGTTFPLFIQDNRWRPYLAHVAVFARVAPDQKEKILSIMKTQGQITLMCGDGTNDVGALKQAHVGIALLNNALPTPIRKPTPSPLPPQRVAVDRRVTNSNNTPRGNPTNAPPTDSLQNRRAALLQQLAEAEAEAETPLIQLGDASIASPFTSKGAAVLPVTHIIRQGRCTLVTTTQMFKILALNCLISAYSLSVLYLDGVKLGDTQATTAGMLIALCFLFISRSKPLEHLSPQKPEPNVFTPYMLLSIIGQFIVHLYCLISVVSNAEGLSSEPKPSPDSQFQPNLMNSAVFLISCAMQVSTFAINYKGHPFMENLMENKPLRMCLTVTGGITLLLAAEISTSLNETFELVPFSPEFRNLLIFYILLDFVGSWMVETVCSFLLQRK